MSSAYLDHKDEYDYVRSPLSLRRIPHILYNVLMDPADKYFAVLVLTFVSIVMFIIWRSYSRNSNKSKPRRYAEKININNESSDNPNSSADANLEKMRLARLKMQEAYELQARKKYEEQQKELEDKKDEPKSHKNENCHKPLRKRTEYNPLAGTGDLPSYRPTRVTGCCGRK